jgi:hypothetical protein
LDIDAFDAHILRFVASSLEDDRIPVTSGFVRGYLHLSAWSATPLKDDPSKCVATYIVHTDLKGSLPVWIVSKGLVGEMIETYSKINKIFSS